MSDFLEGVLATLGDCLVSNFGINGGRGADLWLHVCATEREVCDRGD